MKLLLSFAGISLLVLNAPAATQQPEDRNACNFKVSATKPSIIGPDDVVAMTYVVEQPDSPVEILTIDFKDSFRFRRQRALHGKTAIHGQGPQS